MTVFRGGIGKDCWTFSDGDTRIWCVGDSKLAYYDAVNDSAWVASESPVSLRDHR